MHRNNKTLLKVSNERERERRNFTRNILHIVEAINQGSNKNLEASNHEKILNLK